MATFLQLVNQVLDNLRWDSISSSEFSSPPDPAPAVKRFVNQAKDEVIAMLGGQFVEKEFLLETNRPVTYAQTTAAIVNNAFGTTNQILAASPVFQSAWMAGAKIVMPTTAYDQTAVPIGDGDADPSWKRITEVQSDQLALLDSEFTSDTGSVTDWTIFKDEFDLDATVRQVVSAWINNGPMEVCFVDDIKVFERYFPGNVTMGVPTHIALCRSESTGYFWRARLWPAPDERYVIRYRAKWRLPDLVDHDDEWTLEPEILTMIVDRAGIRAAQSPVQNDPDLAVVQSADLRQRVVEWREDNRPEDPARRLRRRSPGEGGTRSRNVSVSVTNS